MAARNDHSISVLSNQLIEFFRGLKLNQNDELDGRVVGILKDQLKQLKCMETRRQLDQFLCSIDLSLSRMTDVKRDLDVDTLSVGYAGDLMVCVDKLWKVFGTAREGTENKIYLTNEPTICVEKLTTVRNLIRDCLNLHTELYLMAVDISELIENLQIMNINIPIFGDPENRDFQFIDYNGIQWNTRVPVLNFSIPVLNFWIKCFYDILKGLRVGNLCVILDVVKNILRVTWDAGTFRRKRLEDIFRFRMELEKCGIQTVLKTLLTQLSDIKARIQEKSTRSGECVDPVFSNYVMKCYKDYRRALEEALEDPTNELTEEQLTPVLALQYSIPLRDRFKLSKPEAKKLISVIHEIVTREQPNDSYK